MKQCTQCNILKSKSDYYKDSRATDNLTSECRECNKKYKRSLRGLPKVIYKNQLRSSTDRGHLPPSYTLNELIDWLMNKPEYLMLHKEWEKSGYLKSKVPSCDRLDDYKPYSFDNLRLVTWQDNRDKYTHDVKNGINNKISKKVHQLDLEGNFIKEFYSVSAAARELGVKHSLIATVCRDKPLKKRGKYITIDKAYGFRWKYV